MELKLVAIIPTYNEPDDLRAVVDSIEQQAVPGVTVVVANAGDPLPEDFKGRVVELDVPSDHYWTHCIQDGFDWAKGKGFDLVLMTNADTELLPGTLPALIHYVLAHENTVAVAPVYELDATGNLELLYSDQSDWGILLYGKMMRRWDKPENAPKEPFRIDLTGGQGVVFRASVIESYRMDDHNFPHYASDHDLWMQLRADGTHLMLVPSGGITNRRILSQGRKGGLLKTLWWRMTSDMTPESYKIMWRLRAKHLAFPVAVVSFLISFVARWTIGLPKILRRS